MIKFCKNWDVDKETYINFIDEETQSKIKGMLKKFVQRKIQFKKEVQKPNNYMKVISNYKTTKDTFQTIFKIVVQKALEVVCWGLHSPHRSMDHVLYDVVVKTEPCSWLRWVLLQESKYTNL